jgi:sulfur carrier protein ThiS
MKITVKTAGYLVHQLGFSEREFSFENRPTLEEALAAAGLKPDRPCVVTRNGQAIKSGELLQDGDRLFIAPIYSGG